MDRKTGGFLLVLVALLATSLPANASPAQLRAGATFRGAAPGDEAGFQVETGDLDGDGIDDLIVGAWQNDLGGDASGAVYIEYGPLGASKSLVKSDVVLFPEAGGEYVGEGPLGVADLNDDGADDLAIGAPGSFYVSQPGSPGKVGETFLLYGGKRLSGKKALGSIADARFTGIHMTEWLGFGSSGVGDLDDDGFEDIVVGAPATAGFSGAAYLFYGSKAKLSGDVPVTTADAVFVGGRAGEMFGYEAAAGDIDADGDDDLFIASKPLAGGPSSVSLFRGGSRLSGVKAAVAADSQVLLPTVDYFTGPALAADQDITGDRVDDLVVGLGVGLNPLAETATYILPGGENTFLPGPGRGQLATTLIGAGNAVVAGDLNGDRRADLVAGSPYGSNGGSAEVFQGPITEETLELGEADARFAGPRSSAAGHAVAVGHLNRDRKLDLVVGAPGGAGMVFVIFGR